MSRKVNSVSRFTVIGVEGRDRPRRTELYRCNDDLSLIYSLKAKIHYTSFPVTGQKSLVSVVSCRFPNSIRPTTTCCGLVGRVANKSVTSWQLPRLRGSYGEKCVMDFGHYLTLCLFCLIRNDSWLISRYSNTDIILFHSREPYPIPWQIFVTHLRPKYPATATHTQTRCWR